MGSGGSLRPATSRCRAAGQVLEQKVQGIVHGLGIDEVVVVEDQNEHPTFSFTCCRDVVHQNGKQGLAGGA